MSDNGFPEDPDAAILKKLDPIRSAIFLWLLDTLALPVHNNATTKMDAKNIVRACVRASVRACVRRKERSAAADDDDDECASAVALPSFLPHLRKHHKLPQSFQLASQF